LKSEELNVNSEHFNSVKKIKKLREKNKNQKEKKNRVMQENRE
jgi:hypothetical protein